MPPRLSILIPAYRAIGTIEPLANALAALPQLASGEYDVIVTDDASPGGSAALIRERWPAFHVVDGAENLGFGGNVMRGLEAVSGEYLALVNTDIELVGDPFPALLDALADAHIFATMPLVFNTDLGRVENLARLFCHRGLCWHADIPEAQQWTEYARELAGVAGVPPVRMAPNAQPVQAVLCGAFFVCRTAQFRQLGGFDPRYRPYYWEDVDLGYRAVEQSQVCVTVPQALVVHRHSETIGAGATKLRHLLLNQARFVTAHKLKLAESGLRHPRWWMLARSIRELLRGNITLSGAYLRAAIGARV